MLINYLTLLVKSNPISHKEIPDELLNPGFPWRQLLKSEDGKL